MDVKKIDLTQNIKSEVKATTGQKARTKRAKELEIINEVPNIPDMSVVIVDPSDEQIYFVNASRSYLYISENRVNLENVLEKGVLQREESKEVYYIFAPGDVLEVSREDYENFVEIFAGQIRSGTVRVYGRKEFNRIKSKLAIELQDLRTPMWSGPQVDREVEGDEALYVISKKLEEYKKATIPANILQTLEEDVEELGGLFIV